MNVDYPLQFDGRGRSAEADEVAYVLDLIEQILFTTPGERVNRPDFGCGITQMVFAPNSDTLAATGQFLIKGALQRWLGDVIAVEGVEVQALDSTLSVTIQYVVRRTDERRMDSFTREKVSA